jgi:hypothetical protein
MSLWIGRDSKGQQGNGTSEKSFRSVGSHRHFYVLVYTLAFDPLQFAEASRRPQPTGHEFFSGLAGLVARHPVRDKLRA